MDILSGLNEQQQQAVTAPDQHLLIVAGAGSGKTRVLVSRVAWLMTEGGVSPREIMAVTFTNKAAKEMKDRLGRAANIDCRLMWIGTFHALCAKLLRFEGDSFRLGTQFIIYDDTDSKGLIKRCVNELNLDTEDKVYAPGAVLGAISDAKNKLVSAAQYQQAADGEYEQNIGKLYALYQQKLTQNKAVDFDDLLVETVRLLQCNPELLAKYQRRFRHILVDEYQDTNHCQYQLVGLLSGTNGNLFVVGDPDQSIYRWRGADISNILDFSTDYSDCREIKLTENYRSTQNILAVANEVIAHNQKRLQKDLFTRADPGEKVFFHQAETDRDEAHFVIGAVASLINEGYALSECAVLYRTHGQSRLFEEECGKYNLRYRVFGGMKFYERKEVKDTLAYLRLVDNPADNEALQRIYNEPRRGIGKATWDKLMDLATQRQVSALNLLQEADQLPEQFNAAARSKLASLARLLNSFSDFAAAEDSVAKLMKEIWQKTGYYAMLQADKEALEHLDILEQLFDTASDFDGEFAELLQVLQDEEIEFTTPLQAFLARLALSTDLDEQGQEENYLTLMTLHAAKGLE
ncbi:MAG: UvrD-helicase domain-containing protein, partial [Clostridiales bacterium]